MHTPNLLAHPLFIAAWAPATIRSLGEAIQACKLWDGNDVVKKPNMQFTPIWVVYAWSCQHCWAVLRILLFAVPQESAADA